MNLQSNLVMALTRKSILIFQAIISFCVTVFCLHFTFNLSSNSPQFLFIQGKVLGIGLNLEPIGITFLNMVSALWFLTSLYSIGYVDINKQIKANKFTFFMIGAVSSAFMLAIAGDLITSFIFYELLTLFTFPLIMVTGTLKEIQAARKYLVILMGLSLVLFFPAIAIIYYETGSVDYAAGGILSSGNMTGAIAIVSFIMLLYGVAKTAIMPVHFWLPAAMAAPVPVSALLHAVVVVKAGLLILLKICVYIYGIDYLSELFGAVLYSNIALMLCGASVLLSAIIALYQVNIKKLLAYSTIGHMSLCILSAFMFSVSGIKAAIVHMIGHGVSKLVLFFATGVLESKYDSTSINSLNGLVKRSKLLACIFTVATLSMIGIPPLAGVVGKSYIIYALVSDKVNYIGVITLSISVLISASYFIKLLYSIYFMDHAHKRLSANSSAEAIMLFAAILGCIAILLYAISFPFLIEFLDKIQFKSLNQR
jgi:multicomponent Na+:H+ antiporter subunit D